MLFLLIHSALCILSNLVRLGSYYFRAGLCWISIISISIAMHQICDGYNPHVRMGNWFEESYSVPQPSRENPVKLSRAAEIDIGYIDAHLKLRPLNRMARLPPWNTSGLVQAPQYSQMVNKTTTKENFEIGTAEHYFRKWKSNLYEKCNGSNVSQDSCIKVNQFKKDYKMFDAHNVNELLNERPADTSSFKSQVVSNRHEDQRALLKTIYQRDISDTGARLGDASMNSFARQSQTYTETNSLHKPEFRRIRSEITLKNVPPIKTFK